jgi:hypothetical protein
MRHAVEGLYAFAVSGGGVTLYAWRAHSVR